MKTIGLFGEPGSGKTTLIRHLLPKLGLGRTWTFGTLMHGIYYPDHRLYLAGIYDDGPFAGTDRLSMGVQPDAIAFVQWLGNQPDATLLFEGDRLANHSFLAWCEMMGKTLWLRLTVAADVVAARHLYRADSQSSTWLKSRRTKLDNLARSHAFQTLPNDTPADLERNLAYLENHLWERVPQAL
jgi:hypothetical protein